MKENEKRILILGSVFTIAFIVWTYVIQTVDVQPVGQNGTDIGFCQLVQRISSVNKSIYWGIFSIYHTRHSENGTGMEGCVAF